MSRAEEEQRLRTETGRAGARARRRRQLAETATQLIQELGYDRVSVNDLADRAQMSVGGMYRYIRNKSDLLVMACEGIYGGLREDLLDSAAHGADEVDRLRRAMRVYFAACRANRQQILLMYREYRNLPPEAKQRYVDREQAITDTFADLIRAGTASGDFRDVDADVVAHDIVFLGHFPALKSWAVKARPDSPELVEEQLRLVLAGLAR